MTQEQISELVRGFVEADTRHRECDARADAARKARDDAVEERDRKRKALLAAGDGTYLYGAVLVRIQGANLVVERPLVVHNRRGEPVPA